VIRLRVEELRSPVRRRWGGARGGAWGRRAAGRGFGRSRRCRLPCIAELGPANRLLGKGVRALAAVLGDRFGRARGGV